MPQAIGGILASGLGLGVVGTQFVQLGVGLALSALGNNIARSRAKSRRPDKPAPTDVKLTIKEPVGARIKHYGEVRTGGSVVFFRASEGKFYRIVVHGHGETDSIIAYYLDKSEVTLDASGFVTEAQYQYGGRSRVQILTRLGLASQTYYPEIGAIWTDYTTAAQNNGLTTSLVIAEQVPQDAFQDVYPNGEPVLELVMESTKVFDPRSGTTGYSDNAALIIADFIQSVDGFNKPGVVNNTILAQSADDADELMPLDAGGFERRYRLSGSYRLNEEPSAVLRDMLDACNGAIEFQPDGSLGIYVGKWVGTSETMTISDIQSVDSYSTGADGLARYSELPFTYTDRSLDHTEVTGDTWIDGQREIEFRGSVLAAVADFEMAPSGSQARRCAKYKIEIDNPKKRVTITGKPKAARMMFERFIEIDAPSIGLTGTFKVNKSQLDPVNLTPVFELQQFDSEALTRQIGDDGVDQTGTEAPAGSGIPTPTGVAAAGWGIETSPGVFAAAIAVAWDDSPSDALVPVLEYSIAGAGLWQSVATTDNQTMAVISGLTQGTLYDIRLSWRLSVGTNGPTHSVLNVAADTTNATPAAPTGLTVTNNANGTANVDWTASADAEIWRTEIYRDGVFVAMTSSTPSQVHSIIDQSGVGTFAWTAKTVNVAGISSAFTGAVNQTIT